jgi:hypothetical protein
VNPILMMMITLRGHVLQHFYTHTHPILTERSTIAFDQSVERCFRGIVGINADLSRAQWLQATLATKHGGMGLACTARVRWAAYLASSLGCLKNLRTIVQQVPIREMDLADVLTSRTPLMARVRACYDHLQQSLQTVDIAVPSLEDMASEPRGLQNRLTEHISSRTLRELRPLLDKRGRARLDSCGNEGGGWVTCVPKTPSQKLSNEDFRQRVFARLGMDLPGLVRMPCVCRAGQVDPEGHHLTAQCPVGNQRFRTHDALALTWATLFRQAGFLCRMEDPSCFREVEDTNRRADIVIDNWEGGQRAIFDVSVTHPWAQHVLQRSVDNLVPELAASTREDEKIRKYAARCPQNSVFIPLVVESYGRWGQLARPVFDICMDRIANTCCIHKSVVTSYWRQRFSITLQRYTAACVRERAQRSTLRDPSAHGDESSRVDYSVLSYCK